MRLERNQGFSQKELNKIERILSDNLDHLRGVWDGFFNP
jgi:hypothetical protein